MWFYINSQDLYFKFGIKQQMFSMFVIKMFAMKILYKPRILKFKFYKPCTLTFDWLSVFRFVGAYNGSTSERFDRWQTAHNRVLLSHSACSKSQTCCDNSRKPLRNSGNSQCNGNFEIINGSLESDEYTMIRLSSF